MNKVVIDGIIFMLLVFENGLDVWFSGDGMLGLDIYDGLGMGVFVLVD